MLMLADSIRWAGKYFNFRLNSKPKGGHGIHSPFVYDLYTNVIGRDTREAIFEHIEAYRRELVRSNIPIIRTSFGAKVYSCLSGKETTLARVARDSSVPPYMGRLLYRLASHFQPKTIVELGTSLGISTLYLASGSAGSSIVTVEGDPTLANIAASRFRQLGLGRIEVRNGDFDLELPGILDLSSPGVVFVDGNHSYEATIRYFEQIASKAVDESVIVIDDINWSHEMESAWAEICHDRRVSVSIDLFRCGIVFFRKGIAKQHFRLRFGPF